MGRRDHLRTLRSILDLRKIQRQAAEMEVSRADAALRRLKEQRDLRLDELDRRQEGWRETVRGPSLNLALAGAWSKEVVEARQTASHIGAEIREAEAHRGELATAWALTRARAEAAHDLFVGAERKARRHDEEAALNSLTDLLAGRRSMPCA